MNYLFINKYNFDYFVSDKKQKQTCFPDAGREEVWGFGLKLSQPHR